MEYICSIQDILVNRMRVPITYTITKPQLYPWINVKPYMTNHISLIASNQFLEMISFVPKILKDSHSLMEMKAIHWQQITFFMELLQVHHIRENIQISTQKFFHTFNGLKKMFKTTEIKKQIQFFIRWFLFWYILFIWSLSCRLKGSN